VLAVNPSLPVQTVADLIKLAKEKPGQLSFGSAGRHVASPVAELFKDDGTDMLHVPFGAACRSSRRGGRPPAAHLRGLRAGVL